ncbi:MAG: KUP/HAK/KT family potassium transporter [Acidimicrobiales bacterium]
MITPAISVLGAVEGLKVAAPALDPWVLPLSVGILTALFLVQKRGTGGIGKVFGPIMVVWFATLAGLGVREIVHTPEVLQALNPLDAIRFFSEYKFDGFLALGSIFLVVTGGEALYADMGHFGRRPIQLSWYAIVFPALALNTSARVRCCCGCPRPSRTRSSGWVRRGRRGPRWSWPPWRR